MGPIKKSKIFHSALYFLPINTKHIDHWSIYFVGGLYLQMGKDLCNILNHRSSNSNIIPLNEVNFSELKRLYVLFEGKYYAIPVSYSECIEFIINESNERNSWELINKRASPKCDFINPGNILFTENDEKIIIEKVNQNTWECTGYYFNTNKKYYGGVQWLYSEKHCRILKLKALI